MPLVLEFPNRICKRLLDHLQTVILIVTASKEPKTSQDYALA